MFFGAGLFLLQAGHLGTLAAVGLVPCAGLPMMRQEERALRTIIMVMVNTPLRRWMVLKISMEGSDLRHLLLHRSGTELPKGHSRGERLSSGSFCQAAKTWRGFPNRPFLEGSFRRPPWASIVGTFKTRSEAETSIKMTKTCSSH